MGIFVKKIRSPRGFTLIELMIGAVVLGILASLAAPRFQAAYERQKLRGGNKMLVSKLKTARSFAISTKTQHGVLVDPYERTITVFRDIQNPGNLTYESGDSVLSMDTLPQEFQLIYTDCDNDIIMYNANGSASFTGNGNIWLDGYTETIYASYWINVLPSTGRVDSDSHYGEGVD